MGKEMIDLSGVTGDEKLVAQMGDGSVSVADDEEREVAVEAYAAMKQQAMIDEMRERFRKDFEEIDRITEEIRKDRKGLEIVPINDRLLVKPFAANPFTMVMRDGILVGDGQADYYVENETGDWKRQEESVKWAYVVDAGFNCRFCKKGDIVQFEVGNFRPVMYCGTGFGVVQEHFVSAVVNKGMDRRVAAARKLYGGK